MDSSQLTLVAILVSILAIIVPLLALLRKPAGLKRPVALDPNKKIDLVLVSKDKVSHDTRRFRFALPSSEHILGLPVGQHIELSYVKDGEEVDRKYTPVSSDHDVGVVDFMIKVYFKGVHEKFPEGGQMSQYMESLKIGQTLTFSGPKGRYTYQGRGTFSIKQLASQGGGVKVRKAARIGMIAGGTGITPMLQVISAVLRDPSDKTELRLLFANQSEEDILCRKELDELAAKHPQLKARWAAIPGRLRVHWQVWYTVDRPPAGWKYSAGFVNKEMLAEHLPPAGKDTQVLLCGPPLMISRACKPALEALGFTEDNLMVW